MTREQYAALAAKYAIYLLYNHTVIDMRTANGCNLWELLQEGLGNHDNDPQVPLAEIVKYVTDQMGE